MRKILLTLTLALLPGLLVTLPASSASASVDVDPHDKQSLQRGAMLFANYCMACHEASLMRYNRIGQDLGLDEDLVEQYLIFKPGTQVHDVMTNVMSQSDAEQWFGAPAPDLTLYARRHGPDRVYRFLTGFYRDDDQPFGVNNTVVSGVSMPHVLEVMQGLPEPRYEERDGRMVVVGVEEATNGKVSPAEFRGAMRDLTNFMDYMAEPVKAERERLGVRVLIFLFIFLIVTYLLKREYWKDVH